MKRISRMLAGLMLCMLSATAVVWAETAVAPEPAPAAAAETPAVVAETPAAQVSETMLFGDYMSLDQLLQQRMGVSTIKAVTPREAPGILSVITEDEIANSGARDFMDVLKLLPSFEFACDVSGVVDISMRGLWAHEGKVLFLLDGQALNEIAYGTMALGNHIPVENIKQIEIIRGPGSAIYGGYAEFGVINIRTKRGKDLNGASLNGTYSQMTKTYSHRDLNLSFGKAYEDLDVSAHVFFGQGNRSEKTFTSMLTGEKYDMTTNAQLNPYLLNMGVKYKGLEVRAILDEYHATERDWWGANLPMAVRADFNTRILDAKYDLKLGNLTLTPRLNYKEQEPYQRNGVGTRAVIPETYVDPEDHMFEVWVKRQTESLTASYDFTEKNNVLAGVEAYQELGETISDALPQHLLYNNVATFAQGVVDLWVADLTAGVRAERHNQYGDSFVPRLGLTKVMDPLHFKLLFAKAFRVPQLETIVLNKFISPETSRTVEFETGYKISDKMMLTVNVFDTYIDDPIIYFATSSEYQLNSGALGNRGAELDFKYRESWGFVNFAYSFNHIYQDDGFIHPETLEKVDSIYFVPGHDDRVIGLPNQKAVLNANIRVLDQLSVNPSLIWYNQRYGYDYDSTTNLDDQGRMIPTEYAPVLQVNIFVTYAILKELRVGAGVNDITNSAPVYLQAYNGYHAPIPGPSRSVIAKLWYDVKF